MMCSFAIVGERTGAAAARADESRAGPRSHPSNPAPYPDRSVRRSG